MKGWLILIAVIILIISVVYVSANYIVSYDESIVTKATIMVSAASTRDDWNYGGQYSIVETIGGKELCFWGDITSQLQSGKVYEITYHSDFRGMLRNNVLVNSTFLYNLTGVGATSYNQTGD